MTQKLTRSATITLTGMIFGFLLLYGPTLTHHFTWLDDDLHLHNNIRMVEPSVETIAEYWKKPFFGLYIPVTYTVWSIEASLARRQTPDARGILLNPFVFHLGNLIFHGVNTLLVFMLLSHLVSGFWPVLLGTILFAFHPVQIETVAWIAQRRDLLSTMFGLLSIWHLLKGSDGPRDDWNRRYAFATIFFILGMLSKPSLVALPMMAFLLLWGWVGRDAKSTLLWLAPWVVMALPVIFFTQKVQSSAAISFSPPLWFRPIVAGDALTFYLTHLLWPFPLSLDYTRTPEVIFRSKEGYATAVVPLVLFAFAWWKKMPKEGWVAAGLFVAALAPMLGLVTFAFQQFSTVTDHYLYFALFGLALGFAWGLSLLPENSKAIRFAMGAMVICGLTGIPYVAKWGSPELLFQNVLKHYPKSRLANNNFGYYREKQGNFEEALKLYQVAAIDSSWPEAHFNVANMQAKLNQLPQALTTLEKVLQLKPDHANSHYLYGGVLHGMGNSQAALGFLEKAIALDGNRGYFYVKLGAILTGLGRFDEALKAYEVGLTKNPRMPDAFNNMGVTYQRMGKLSAALAAFQRSVELDPEYLHAHVNLGGLLANMRRYREALPHLGLVARRNPSDLDVRVLLAKCMAETGDIPSAIAIYQEVLKADPRQAEARAALGTLQRMPASKK